MKGSRRLSLRFAWYDMWIGAFYDVERHVLYVCPLPCILVTYRFPESEWVPTADGSGGFPRKRQS